MFVRVGAAILAGCDVFLYLAGTLGADEIFCCLGLLNYGFFLAGNAGASLGGSFAS